MVPSESKALLCALRLRCQAGLPCVVAGRVHGGLGWSGRRKSRRTFPSAPSDGSGCSSAHAQLGQSDLEKCCWHAGPRADLYGGLPRPELVGAGRAAAPRGAWLRGTALPPAAGSEDLLGESPARSPALFPEGLPLWWPHALGCPWRWDAAGDSCRASRLSPLHHQGRCVRQVRAANPSARWPLPWGPERASWAALPAPSLPASS